MSSRLEDLSLIRLTEIAADYGVTADAVADTFKRHGKRLYKLGRVQAASLSELEWYASHRERRAPTVLKRPAGWLGIKQVVDRLNLTASTVGELNERGDLDAVRVGNQYFYNPEHVERERLKRSGVPPAWVAIADLIHEHGWRDDIPYRHVRRLGLQTLNCMVRGDKGTAKRLAIRREDAPRLVAVMSLPFNYPGRMTTTQLCAACGVTSRTVHSWVYQGMPTLQCRHSSYWFDPAEVLAFFDQHSPAQDQRAARLRAHLAEQDRSAA
ncbi:helix-turn-helix domain-containing protein [Deinococcus multiflagellatus]|uniref:Helix-turn-helix domain-containing protein n=1 Tax=Deinococcus multiflagellatus TaxID=1656887 RepID=A0ABW1ZFU6_9DEIO|nr:helix-turn-helix domain-containing protein [Deinococcus multiflagellatus]MBZ9712216.1 helix-turn-helix domain-containing protein [Deinococcus multiflagellatus]